MRDLQRVPLRFQTKHGENIHFHIVMAANDTTKRKWGALGISRVESLMYKELRFDHLSDMILDYIRAYEAIGHDVENVFLGLPFHHDLNAMSRIEWIALVVPMSKKVAWERKAHVFDQHAKEMCALEDFYQHTSCTLPRVISWRDEDRTLALYKEGSRVEARCRGSTEFRPAEIIRNRMNGTVDVLFDNGEKERGVNTSLIRGGITEVAEDCSHKANAIPSDVSLQQGLDKTENVKNNLDFLGWDRFCAEMKTALPQVDEAAIAKETAELKMEHKRKLKPLGKDREIHNMRAKIQSSGYMPSRACLSGLQGHGRTSLW
jgi:hypothetical protein